MTSESDLERSVPRRVTWRLIPLLGLTYILAHLDRVNVSFAALTMNADLGFSDTVYGLGAGLFFLGYFLFEVPSNVVLERFGARRLITAIMVLWGGMSAAMALVQTQFQFYALRFALGIAESGLYPGIMLYLTYWFRDRDRAGAVGLFALALAVAGIVGSPLSGWILDAMHHRGGLAGWQWLFILEGLPTVVLAGVVWTCLTDRPAQAQWLSAGERDWLERAIGAPTRVGHEAHAGWWAKLTHPAVLVLSAIYFLFLGAFAGSIFWSPKLVHAVAPTLSNSGVGLAVGIPYVAFALAMVLWGRHSDRTGERAWHVAIGGAVAAAGYAAMGLAGSLAGVLAGLVLALAGSGAAFSCFWGLVMGALDRQLAAVGIAVVNSAGALGSFAAVSALGWLYDASGGYAAGLMMLSGAAALAAGGTLVGAARVARRVPAS